MREPPNRTAAVVGTIVFPAVAWLSAAGYVAVHNWFGVNDLYGFAFWSFVLALPAYPVLRIFDAKSGSWSAWWAYLAAIALGVLAGVASTVVVATILGGWIGAFSFPVFLCWLAGSLASFISCALVRRPRTWFAVLPAAVAPILLTIGLLRIIYAKPADLLIHVVPSATRQQVETIWSEVVGTPSPSGTGHWTLPGIQTVSRADGEGEVRLRVGFVPGTSEERRAEIVARVLASPLVARTSDVPPTHGVDGTFSIREGEE
jgi:hypothetical protein